MTPSISVGRAKFIEHEGRVVTGGPSKIENSFQILIKTYKGNGYNKFEKFHSRLPHRYCRRLKLIWPEPGLSNMSEMKMRKFYNCIT